MEIIKRLLQDEFIAHNFDTGKGLTTVQEKELIQMQFFKRRNFELNQPQEFAGIELRNHRLGLSERGKAEFKDLQFDHLSKVKVFQVLSFCKFQSFAVWELNFPNEVLLFLEITVNVCPPASIPIQRKVELGV